MRDLAANQSALALGGAQAEGLAHIQEIGPLGMITLRAKPDTPGLAQALQAACGCTLPGPREISRSQDAEGQAQLCGWMSPDEFLVILPHGRVTAALAALAQGLDGQHHLAVDVSDARAVFRVEGALADQVLRKLTPADLDQLAEGELRRSRLAQVAAAFWAEDGGYTIVCFRSVAGYMMDLLANAAKPGSGL